LVPFFISEYEMTQSQWERFTGENPSWHTGLRARPVEYMSWMRCREVLWRLGLALPTEARWEYAARAKTNTALSNWHIDHRPLDGFANLADRSFGRKNPRKGFHRSWNDGYPFTAPVGSFPANKFGLHDVHGNVAEWCLETLGPYDFYAPEGGSGERWVLTLAAPGDVKIVRGGSYATQVKNARCSARAGSLRPDVRRVSVGVRPARGLSPSAS
jgi:formylglycine-generating enzyme required for sulfatase activity